MNDIIPPKRPLGQDIRPRQRPATTDQMRRGAMHASPIQPSIPPQNLARTPMYADEPLLEAPEPQLLLERPKRRVGRLLLWIVAGLVVLLVAAAVAMYMWYQSALAPVSDTGDKVRITVTSGSTYDQIGDQLQREGVIRSSLAFTIYARLSGTHSQLQAGTYALSPSESVSDIIAHLTSGNVDQFSITFLPGATLAENRQGLIDAGYDATDVDAALQQVYQSPLFAGKPSSTDLEGYIYGETYTFASDAPVSTVLETAFKEFYKQISDNDLQKGFEQQGLDLFQAITLASIIQREVPDAADQRKVAQVFLKRLNEDMELGSDVTYQYAAKKLGVAPTPDLDSPYNTRKFPGLPPGPIATPGLTALQAVAAPASGDYLYFLSGDDDVTYFARTVQEHEQNIVDHCQIKCSVF